MSELTALFNTAKDGDASAIGEIYSQLSSDLRNLAHSRIRQLSSRSMIDTMSLVHESHLKLIKTGSLNVDNRNQFLAYAASVLRSVVVDFVRQARTQQHGGGSVHVPVNSNVFDTAESPADEIIRVNGFLNAL